MNEFRRFLGGVTVSVGAWPEMNHDHQAWVAVKHGEFSYSAVTPFETLGSDGRPSPHEPTPADMGKALQTALEGLLLTMALTHRETEEENEKD